MLKFTPNKVQLCVQYCDNVNESNSTLDKALENYNLSYEGIKLIHSYKVNVKSSNIKIVDKNMSSGTSLDGQTSMSR